MDKMPSNLSDLRMDLAIRSGWNIGFFVAGMLLWIGILVTNLIVPIETGRMIWIALTFGVFPVAVLVSKLVRADPFCNDNPLGQLVGYSHMSVVSLSFPIFVITAVYAPSIQILAMAILLSIDFYVMSWVFGSALFGIHAAGRLGKPTGVARGESCVGRTTFRSGVAVRRQSPLAEGASDWSHPFVSAVLAGTIRDAADPRRL